MSPSDENAKAVQEVAKATGKAIDAAEKAGGFFSRVFGQPIEDTVGRFWGDPIRAARIENGIALSLRVQKKLTENGVENIEPIELSVGVPLIEAATLETDTLLKEMWSNLLASAIDPSKEDVDKSYVKVLELLTPTNALFLKWLWENRFTTRKARPWEIKKGSSKDIVVDQAFNYRNMSGKVDYSDHDVRSLIRFGIVDSTYREFSRSEHDDRIGAYEDKFYISNGTEEFQLTDFGKAFCASIIAD
jgi:hypothetical protein